MKECDVCGREYESKRADSKTCGVKCRVKRTRGEGLSVTDVTDNVTDKPLSVTKSDKSVTDKLSVTSGKKLIKWNVPGPMPEGSEWNAGDVVDREAVSFQGRKLSELNMEDEIVIGQKVFKVRELRWWMLEGPLVRDGGDLAGNKRMNLSPQEKRKRFRELMYQYDIRYGARNSDGDLIARC